MLTSLLKGVLFVIVMTFYSVCVWRTVNEYFGKEFKNYIHLDPDVRQDKELRTLLSAQHPPDETRTLLRVVPITTSNPNPIEANNYNEPQIGAATNPMVPREEAKQITGDDFSITVKSIKHSTSKAEATKANHHATMAMDESEESRTAGASCDVTTALTSKQHQCLTHTTAGSIGLKDLADWHPLSEVDGGIIKNSDVTGGDDEANDAYTTTTYNVGGNQNESNGNVTTRIINDGGDDNVETDPRAFN